MKISDLLNSNNVFPELEATDKDDVISKLVDTLSQTEDSTLVQNVYRAVMERENVMSTGVGKGLAIPHGKVSGLNTSYVAFAKLKTPINYGSIDGKSVNLIFLLVGPETQSSLHIKLLSRISRLMNNEQFRAHLIDSNSVETIIERFRSEENQFP